LDDSLPWTLEALQENERELFRRLAQLYLHDFSEFEPEDVDESGRFLWPEVERYGREEGRDAWLLRIDAKPAGFVLVDRLEPTDAGLPRHMIAEFFVIRAFRRSGHGARMAMTIFDRYPGPWRVMQIEPNQPAIAFWRRVIGAYTHENYRESTLPSARYNLIVQEFVSPPRA
jgi:predicted acetyltransferase